MFGIVSDFHTFLIAYRPSNVTVCLRDGSEETVLCAAVIADETCFVTHSQLTDAGPTSPSIKSVTPDPGRVATGAAVSKLLVGLHGKSP